MELRWKLAEDEYGNPRDDLRNRRHRAGTVTVIGALVFAVVWEVCAIRRTIERHRKPDPDELFWRQQRALTEPK